MRIVLVFFIIVFLRNEEDKEKALMVLNGFEFKGKKMIAIRYVTYFLLSFNFVNIY